MWAICWGVLIAFSYDCIRIIRRICPHGKMTAAAEDILFWLTWAMVIYGLLYTCDYGSVRSYTIVGMSLGVCVYSLTVSRFFVKYISSGLKWLIRQILTPVRWFFRSVSLVLTKIMRKFKKIVNSFSNMLKKTKKPVTIRKTGKQGKKSGGINGR